MKLLLTTEQACDILSIGRTTLYKVMRERGIDPVKIGSATRWRRSDLELVAGYPASLTTTEASHTVQ